MVMGVVVVTGVMKIIIVVTLILFFSFFFCSGCDIGTRDTACNDSTISDRDNDDLWLVGSGVDDW